ncbi:MAG: hypothetical protein M3447_07010 [Acidobacteriota bacterium]|nr:hypothetical protein [Acidobacteriota bacterium]
MVVKTGHLAPVTCVAFRPDGRVLATGSPDKKIKLWDVSNRLEFRTIKAHAAIEALAFSENGEPLLCATEDGQLTVWDVSGAQELRRFGNILDIGGSQRDLLLVTLSHSGRVVAETPGYY